jgi:hypothetical protein
MANLVAMQLRFQVAQDTSASLIVSRLSSCRALWGLPRARVP